MTSTCNPNGSADLSQLTSNLDPASAAKPLAMSEASQLALAHKYFKRYASFGAYAPNPDRSADHYDGTADPYGGEYRDIVLPPVTEHRMRQAYDMQMWLCDDAAGLAHLTGNPNNPSEVDAPNQAELAVQVLGVQARRDSLHKLQHVQLSHLHRHVELADDLFERLQHTDPTGARTTPLDEGCLSLMTKADIDIPESMNALALYKALSRRQLALEQEVVSTSLELLRDDLHIMRLGLYLAAGEFLHKQAQTVMDELLEPENAEQIHARDEIHQHLQDVLLHPLFTPWPAPDEEPKDHTPEFGWTD